MSDFVLVPGGAGFLGSHLCDRLVAAGRDVLALDNLSSGDQRHVAHLMGRAHFRLLRHDITQPLPREAFGAAWMFNMACPASPPLYQARPVQTTLASVLGLWHLLEQARLCHARLMQASTSEVYGDPEVHPQPETYVGHVNPIGLRSCYDEGKRCGEAMCFAYHRQYGVAVRVARIFNSYGPRLRPGDGRVVSNFIVQALTGRPLTVHGHGQQTRSFCYVDDTVDGLMRLMESDAEGPLNIGSAQEHTVLELAETVLRLTASRSHIEHRPMPEDDPRRRRPDLARTTATLGWQPRVSLEDGLRETISYFRRELAESRLAVPA